LPRPYFDQLLVGACESAVGAARAAPEMSQPGVSDEGVEVVHRVPNSRREQLLRAAAQAFRRYGYQAVGIDDIGAGEAGIAGPAIYRYFESKAEMLATLITRLDEWFALETMRALRHATDDRNVLGDVVAGHVRVAIDAPDLVSVAVTESDLLPEAARNRVRRVRADREAEWLRWLRVARSDLSEPSALILINAAMFLVYDTVRVPHLLARPDLAKALTDCAMAVLLDTDAPQSSPAGHVGRPSARAALSADLTVADPSGSMISPN
jgi:AcrR family transcriptional regulator